jgi:uncharacterized protein YjbI with pentapeptide repeats
MAINFQTNRQVGLDLTNTDLTTADLRGAFLEGAYLTGANLEEANLRGANLIGANLIAADLTGANLTGADLTGAILKHADLTGADLTRANLEEANLAGADLESADLEDANLAGADLTRAKLKRAYLAGADLTRAILTRAKLEEANLTGANLTRANLTGADLEEANLTGAILTDAILRHADLTGAIGLPRGVVVTGPTGVAYEVHNAFSTFQSKQTDYLAIIAQPNFEGGVAKFSQLVKDIFKNNIQEVFPNDANKQEQFNRIFNKSKDYLMTVNTEVQQLIYKSITFAFSQGNDFKEQYIITFLDETCNAYTGTGDNTSCVKGILERYVLSVGNAVQVLCSDECENETYKKLDILLNSKFIIADTASSWWETEAIKPEIKGMDGAKRKENFIAYLTSEAKRVGSDNKATKTKIEEYANNIDYSFAELQLGGRKSKKSRKSSKKSNKPDKSSKKSSKTSSNKSNKSIRKSKKGGRR